MIPLYDALFTNSADVRDALGVQIQHRPADGNLLDRIVVEWNEVKNENLRLPHRLAFAINKEGQVGVDCSKRLVYKKIVISTLIRPLHTFRVLYSHMSDMKRIIGQAIFSYNPNAPTGKEAFCKSIKLIGYMLAAPVFELAMVIVGIAGVVLAPVVTPLDRSFVYRIRAAIATMEIAMFQGEKLQPFSLTMCFQSLDLKQEVIQDYSLIAYGKQIVLKNIPDTDYIGCTIQDITHAVGEYEFPKIFETIIDGINPALFACKNDFDLSQLSDEKKSNLKSMLARRAMINYARANVRFRQRIEGCNSLRIFYDVMTPNEVYQSPCLNNMPEKAENVHAA